MSIVEGLTLEKTLESVEKRIKALEKKQLFSWSNLELELLYNRRSLLKKRIIKNENDK